MKIQDLIFDIIFQLIILLFFGLIGAFLTRIFKLDSKFNILYGYLFTIATSLANAKLGLAQIYTLYILAFILIIQVIISLKAMNTSGYSSVVYISNHLKVNELLSFILITIFSSSYSLSLKNRFGAGVFSAGNVDPVNYLLLAKHVAKNGFKSTKDFMNHDLGYQASWDWPGVHGFVATIGHLLKGGVADNYSLFLSLLLNLTCVGAFISFKVFIPHSNRLLNLLLLSFVFYFDNLSFLQYVYMNGFFAQIIVLSVICPIISLIYCICNAISNQIKIENITLFFYGFLFGTCSSIYLPLGLIINVFAFINLVKLVKSHNISKICFLILGYLVGAFYLLTYLSKDNSALILSGNSINQPGWKIEGNLFYYFLPWNTVCMPGLPQERCSQPVSSFNLIANIIFIFTIILIYSKKRGYSQKSFFTKIIMSSIVLIFIGTSIRAGLHSYRLWKVLSSLEYAFYFLFLTDLIKSRFADKPKSKKEKPEIQKTIYNTLIVTCSILLAIFSILSITKIGDWVKNSPYVYTTNEQLHDLGKIKYDNLNIQIEGVNGMLAALYSSAKSVRLISNTPFYEAMSEVRGYHTLTFTNTDNAIIIK